MKTRQNLYIDREIAAALDKLAATSRGNKSRLVNDALADWLARRGTKEVDDLLKPRLDRISREIALLRRDTDILSESQALFIRYFLMVTAPLPPEDEAGRASGRARFEAFVAELGEQVAAEARTLSPDKDDDK